MPSLPDKLLRKDVLQAIDDLRLGRKHSFGPSVRYDLMYEDDRFAPKAVAGLAAERAVGFPFGPYDFKGGTNSKCFKLLTEAGFEIVRKLDFQPLPEEIDEEEEYTEGSVQKILINRYERDRRAREKCVAHYGAKCQVCNFDFEQTFGIVGKGYIHVHHVVQLAALQSHYIVDPVLDLRPVCPNCHAMLHRRTPPYSVTELRRIVEDRYPNRMTR
ncbi:MAG: endonuclease [Edaphobacter sp.]|nr:endonuclease [Edaphobacter sp.]